MCLVLHRGSDLWLLLCAKNHHQSAPPPPSPSTKTGLYVGGRCPMGKTCRDVSWSWGFSPLSGQKQNDPAKEFTQQWRSLMSENNAKSRRVGWRLCRSLWDRVLAVSHVGDGQHQKHDGLWRGEAGSGVRGYFQLWWIFTEGPSSTLGNSWSGGLEK